jgi:hypothetical protein
VNNQRSRCQSHAGATHRLVGDHKPLWRFLHCHTHNKRKPCCRLLDAMVAMCGMGGGRGWGECGSGTGLGGGGGRVAREGRAAFPPPPPPPNLETVS